MAIQIKSWPPPQTRSLFFFPAHQGYNPFDSAKSSAYRLEYWVDTKNREEKRLDFSHYDSMMSHRRAIIPYDTKKSRAYKKVLEGEMPRCGPPLSEEQIEALGEWIRRGAKND